MEPQFTYWYGNKCDPCKLDSHRWETITTHRGIHSSVSGYLGSSDLPQYSRSSGIKQNVGLTWIQFHAYIQPGQPWSLLDLPHTRSSSVQIFTDVGRTVQVGRIFYDLPSINHKVSSWPICYLYDKLSGTWFSSNVRVGSKLSWESWLTWGYFGYLNSRQQTQS